MLTKNRNISWFTLIELLVVIAVIWVLALGISNISFSQSIDKQKSNQFNNDVYNLISDIKNHSLLWKWIWTDLIIADAWKINISNETSSWTITTKYLSWTNRENYNTFYVEVFQSIEEIKCYDIGWTTNIELNTVDIYLTWSELWLSWCNDSNRVIEFKTKFKKFEKWIKLNSVSWVIETY